MPRHILTLSMLISGPLIAGKKNDFFSADVGAQRTALSGSLSLGKGTVLDVKKDLGINKAKMGLKTMISRATSHHKFAFKIEKYKHIGSKKLSSKVLVNGASLATASLVSGKVSLKWAKAKYRYRFTPSFSLGSDINALRVKAMIHQKENKKTLFLPAVGVDYEKPLEEGLNIIANASTTVGGTSIYHDAYAGLSYDLKLIHCSALHVGYQYKDLHIHSGLIDADMKYQGLYAGLSMKF